MSRAPLPTVALALALGALFLAGPATAQVSVTSTTSTTSTATVTTTVDLDFGSATNLIVPTSTSFGLDRRPAGVALASVAARVSLMGRTARTVLQIELANPGPRREEAVLLVPLPAGAVVSGFDFQGPAAEPTAQLLRWDHARAEYDRIVAQIRDPALLEFAGHDLLRSSVFPVEPGGTQSVRITWESLLVPEGARIDYLLPRTASLERRVPWSIEVDVDPSAGVLSLYSPSHELLVKRTADGGFSAHLAADDALQPGAFRLSLLSDADGPPASIFAYPDPLEGGGFFLALATPPSEVADVPRWSREITLVLDRSGSMAGGKLDQAKAAVLQVVEGLRDGESFNLVDYSTTVSRFAAKAVPRTDRTVADLRAYLAALRPHGGTNIHDALVEALAPAPISGSLPLILFLTDGLPTVGRTTERDIRALVEAGNPHGRRVFTFGVGDDVNAPLLDRIADVTRAVTTYVKPSEDVELAVARVASRLQGPVLTDLVVEALGVDGSLDTRRIHDLVPIVLPDLYGDDQLVVLGRYRGHGSLRLRLSGSPGVGGRVGSDGSDSRLAWHVETDLDAASTGNAFVPRLWAARRIAFLVDEIRQAGGDGRLPETSPFDDPALAELAREVLALSTRFGILTEYTAFLATEGTDLGSWDALHLACAESLDDNAVKQRWGGEAVRQGAWFNRAKSAARVDLQNRFEVPQSLAADVAGRGPVLAGNVQQLADRAFYKRGNRWIDGGLVESERTSTPDEVIAFGSAAHHELLDTLLAEGRAALLSLSGETLLEHDGRCVLITPPSYETTDGTTDGSPDGSPDATPELETSP